MWERFPCELHLSALIVSFNRNWNGTNGDSEKEFIKCANEKEVEKKCVLFSNWKVAVILKAFHFNWLCVCVCVCSLFITREKCGLVSTVGNELRISFTFCVFFFCWNFLPVRFHLYFCCFSAVIPSHRSLSSSSYVLLMSSSSCHVVYYLFSYLHFDFDASTYWMCHFNDGVHFMHLTVLIASVFMKYVYFLCMR